MIGRGSTRPAAPAPSAAVRRRMGGWRERLARTGNVLFAPRVRIELFGGEEARLVFDAFTAPHPRFRVVPAKSRGVALIRVPDSIDDYLAVAGRSLERRTRQAEAKGYRHVTVSPDEHLDEIIDINRSAPWRQARPMDPAYLDPGEVAHTFAHRDEIHAVVDAPGRVRAYALTPVVGDVVVLSVLLGHADDLPNGVMYLLVTGVVRTAIAHRSRDGRPGWVMYDTFWGASRGLAEFKTRLGFRPYTVNWAWAPARAARGTVGA